MPRIITRTEWGAKPPTRPLTKWQYVSGWIQHWAGVYVDPDQTTDEYAQDIRNEQAYHQNVKNASDILYNFLVCPNGDIFEGRGWDYKSAAQGNTFWNAHGLAVQYHGGPGTPLTEAGMASLRWLHAEALDRFPIMAEDLPHSAVRDSPTFCPGDELREFIKHLRDEEDDMALSPEDKKWLQETIAFEIAKSIGKVASGANKTVYEAARQAIRNTPANVG